MGRNRLRWIALLAVAVSAGCTNADTQGRSGPAATVTNHLATCGQEPHSSGPAATSVVLSLTAPRVGKSGTVIVARARYKLVGPATAVRDLGQPADVVIVQNATVVGAYSGAVGGTGISASREFQPVALSSPVLLSGCPAEKIDYAHPNATRHALPAGRYQLFAILHAGGHDTAPSVIVSAAAPIRVTK